jgi:hypothetical protein
MPGTKLSKAAATGGDERRGDGEQAIAALAIKADTRTGFTTCDAA